MLLLFIVNCCIFGLLLASQDLSGETKSDTCNAHSEGNFEAHGLNELNEWANNLPILKQQDDNIVNHMKDLVRQQDANPLLSDETLIEQFQRILAFPLQAVCNVGKWVALKRWHWRGGSTDGERYLCMDNFFEDVRNKKCLIYSFGIADDYSFEKEMGSIGCTVHAFDPTIDLTPKPSKNVFFHKIGLSHYKGNMEVTVNHDGNRKSEPLPVTTLKDAIQENGDHEKEITYVKVDIESSEIKAIPQWIQSGVLKNVRQIGIELHTGKTFFDRSGQAKAAKSLLKSLSELYDLGFRYVSYAPNLFVDKSQDHGGQYYTYIDILLYKPYK